MDNFQDFPVVSGGKISGLIKERYAIEHKLGQGGFAETFLARDTTSDQPCVLKILSWKDIPDWKVIELFEREARVLSQMDHTRIPKFIEFFTEKIGTETKIILVQEYISGKNLAQYIEEGKHYTEKEVIGIALEVTSILEYLQSFSPAIIHRDIKPSNLLLSTDGELHLIDFGAVRDKVLHHQKTEGGGFTVVGTYGFMPFEQFQGQAIPASDIYSLGMTLITLLSHKEPHEMESTGSDLAFESYVNISKDFAAVLKKMTAHRAEDRYQNAKQLRHDLQALLDGKQPERIHTGGRKKISNGTVVALALLLFVVLFAWLKKPALSPIAPETAVAPVPRAKTALKPPYEGGVVRGSILFDGKPVQTITNLQPEFWFRDEEKGTAVSANASYSNGEFQISGLPPGRYGVSLQFDLNARNPLSYPGDLRAWEIFTVAKNADTALDVGMLKILHLLQPEDNGVVLRDWNLCCEKRRPVHPKTLQLQWNSLGEDVFYDYSISRFICPYKSESSIASGTTDQTRIQLTLPPTKQDEYYLLQLYARKEGRQIGMLMTHGANGYGWDYRFRAE